MAAASEPDNTRLPGTVFTPRQVRLLKIAVIAMGVALVGGFAAVLGTIVYRASQLGKTAPSASGANTSAPASLSAELPIPKDAEVTALSLDGDRLALHLKTASGAELLVIDISRNKVLSRIKLKPE
jgi:hypothetical protein